MRGTVAKRLRKLAAKITKQGTPNAAPIRGLVGFWWKLKRGNDFSMRERFQPPAAKKPSIFSRIKDHWNNDKFEGWPNPKEFRVWVIAKNAPDTFRWAYRRLKKMRRRHYVAA